MCYISLSLYIYIYIYIYIYCAPLRQPHQRVVDDGGWALAGVTLFPESCRNIYLFMLCVIRL